MQTPNYLIHKHSVTIINQDEIEAFTSNDDFNVLGVELFKEILSPLIVVATVYRKDDSGKSVPFNHEEAALIGNLVRYNKLCSAFLEQFTRKRSETSLIFLRCIAETYINLKYFLKFKDKATITHYIKHSLRQEKKMIELIRQNVSNKTEADDIELRMMESINRAFRKSDFEEDEIGNSSKWDEKVKSRLSEIFDPQAYVLIYGSSSHAIHGNWQDLIHFHLTEEGDGFQAKTDWSVPTLQILSGAILLSCDLLRNYAIEVLPESQSKNELIDFIDDLGNRTFRLDNQHEKFLQKHRQERKGSK
ncbi:MAG: hypothetical protein JST02_13935 [Bacteroidetes bacterium]|nr:hypothetical protein [Bacteroidota bacterium]